MSRSIRDVRSPLAKPFGGTVAWPRMRAERGRLQGVALGLRARPLVRESTEALVVELPVVDKGLADGALALDEGEAQLRGCAQPAAVVRLRATGDVEVTPAPGRAVILAGGERAVARRGDAVRVTIPMEALVPPGAPGGPLPAAPTGLTVEGEIVAGNERARA